MAAYASKHSEAVRRFKRLSRTIRLVTIFAITGCFLIASKAGYLPSWHDSFHSSQDSYERFDSRKLLEEATTKVHIESTKLLVDSEYVSDASKDDLTPEINNLIPANDLGITGSNAEVRKVNAELAPDARKLSKSDVGITHWRPYWITDSEIVTLVSMQNDTNDTSHIEEDCTEPAYLEFPPDGFTSTQRKHGAILLHFFIVIYMFVGLAIVCDDYFVSALEKICERLHVGEDVAGATFMAAGSSAPELFTSIIGVFVAKGDVGTGTIVGSAVFNILFIIGMCGIGAGAVVDLTWWPLFRDTSYYSLSVVVLIVVIYDSEVTWVESVIMLILYCLYIVVMKLNSKIVWKLAEWKVKKEHAAQGEEIDIPADINVNNYKEEKARSASMANSYNEEKARSQSVDIPMIRLERQATVRRKSSFGTTDSHHSHHTDHSRHSDAENSVRKQNIDEDIRDNPRQDLSAADATLKIMLTDKFSAKTRLQAATRMLILERRKQRADLLHLGGQTKSQLSVSSLVITKSTKLLKREIEKSYESLAGSHAPSYVKVAHGEPQTEIEEEEEFDSWKSGPPTADGCWAVFKWVFSLPLNIILYFSVPDCRKKNWESWFMVTFIMSIVWIAAFSYVMVWMVAIIGYTLHLPDSIMGITFLAAGTSIPDGMASLIVARQGLGDMAVSNSIGSNVFDILLGLALPWFVKTVIISTGQAVHINSNGLVFSVGLLFGTVIVTIGSIHFNKWRLTPKLGWFLMIVYVVFLAFSSMIEFNVFGYVNAPPCKHH